MFQWLFFDVGNILFDEDCLNYVNHHHHWKAVERIRPEMAFCDLLALREERCAAGSRWPLFEAVAPFLDERRRAEVWRAAEAEVRSRFAELSPPIPGASALLEQLAQHYRLGLIANQGRECRDRLEALGWLGRFDILALSEEVGAWKPDRALFEFALERAGTDPSRCLMVGDRLDNDILPAAELGMATAWVRWPRRAAKGWSPGNDDASAFLASLERSAALAPTLWPHVRPSIAIDTIADLHDALREPGT